MQKEVNNKQSVSQKKIVLKYLINQKFTCKNHTSTNYASFSVLTNRRPAEQYFFRIFSTTRNNAIQKAK